MPPHLRLPLAFAGGGILFLVVYPILVDHLIARYGIRVSGVGLLAISVALGVVRRRADEAVRLGFAPLLGVGVLTILAMILDDRRFLLLIPAGINLILFGVFAASLRGPGSVIEEFARIIETNAPEFIRPYCRKSTVAWCGFFLANAATIAVLAFVDPALWRAYTMWGTWVLMGAFVVVEFLIRKWWFRYYFHDGPFDRVWGKLFPAANTPMGRRSAEHIRQFRAEMEARDREASSS